jgi:hypothetical protein
MARLSRSHGSGPIANQRFLAPLKHSPTQITDLGPRESFLLRWEKARLILAASHAIEEYFAQTHGVLSFPAQWGYFL